MNNTITYKNKKIEVKFSNYIKLQLFRNNLTALDFILPTNNQPLDKFLNALRFLVNDPENKDLDWNKIEDCELFLSKFDDIYLVSQALLLQLQHDGLINLDDNIKAQLEGTEPKNAEKEEVNPKKKQKKASSDTSAK